VHLEGDLPINLVAAAQKLDKPGDNTVNNPVAIVDYESGTVHFLYCLEYMRCFYMRSDDDGKTWTEPVEITKTFETFRPDYDWRVIATGPAHGIQLCWGKNKGRLVVPVWLSLGTGGHAHRPSVASTIYSDDHGKTWKRGDIAVPDTPEFIYPNETVVVQLMDGRVMLNSRSESKCHRRLITTSLDGATKWSQPRFDEALLEPICMAGMVRVRVAKYGSPGIIAFSNPDNLSRRDGKKTPGVNRDRKNMSIKLSYDEGKTWPVNRTLEERFSGYSDLATLGDGTMLCFYERGSTDGKTIYKTGRLTVARFNEEWVRHDAAVEPELLGATKPHQETMRKAAEASLMHIAPVHLPVNPPGDCNHYGWPVSTMVDDTIVVMHRRIPGHNPRGAGKPHEYMSYGIVLRSDDGGGQTWSQPYDLRDCMKPEDRNRGGIVPLSHRMKFDKGNKSPQGYKVHLHAIGTTRDGDIVAINNHGVFRSEDKGRTWKHFSKALRDDKFPHEIINLGPRIVDHPQHGLLAFGNWFGEVDSYHKYSNQLVAIRSRDAGATWKVEEHSAGFRQYEPAVLYHDHKFLFVTRNQNNVRAHRQMTWTPGNKPDVIATNLTDPRYVDTVDLSLNPVTKRLEIVRSERYRMELWLWSIDPADWSKGQWRRECRLFAREGKFYSTADGFHPAGAVIDLKRKVQHIFIYTGHPNGPAGVFRITRTLDTPRLAELLNGASVKQGTP